MAEVGIKKAYSMSIVTRLEDDLKRSVLAVIMSPVTAILSTKRHSKWDDESKTGVLGGVNVFC